MSIYEDAYREAWADSTSAAPRVQPCGHPWSDQTSADGYTFCAVCAVTPEPSPVASLRTQPEAAPESASKSRPGVEEGTE